MSQPLQPNTAMLGKTAYGVPRNPAPIDLYLDGNEGMKPPVELLQSLGDDVELIRRYPDKGGLEVLLAQRFGVSVDRLLVTAGGDDAIDRVCRAMLDDGLNIIVPSPTFEMIPRYAALARAEVRRVEWHDFWPTDKVLRLADAQTRVIAMVTPNNPTGAVVPIHEIERVANAVPHALILVDLAYVEFADEDPTLAVLNLPNTVVVRTLSKALGLAGLRVGCALSQPQIIDWLRVAGAPYAVAAPSVAIATAALTRSSIESSTYVEEVRRERTSLTTQLEFLGADPHPSQANFVLCRPPESAWFQDALAGLGIAVRRWPDHAELHHHIRIACPGDEVDFARLQQAIGAALSPEAILFDMDGVLVDVSESYRAAIVATVEALGGQTSIADIAAMKAEGDANNDWVVSQRLLSRQGIDVPLGKVIAEFEGHYQGTPEEPGLRETEAATMDRAFFEAIRQRFRVGIVTGRPRADATRFLDAHNLTELVDAMVCMDEASAPKPHPAPVRLCMEQLGVKRAWMLGDTPDDVRAARGAGVVPIGVVAPGDRPDAARITLGRAGAGRVIEHVVELQQIIDLALEPAPSDHGQAP